MGATDLYPWLEKSAINPKELENTKLTEQDTNWIYTENHMEAGTQLELYQQVGQILDYDRKCFKRPYSEDSDLGKPVKRECLDSSSGSDQTLVSSNSVLDLSHGSDLCENPSHTSDSPMEPPNQESLMDSSLQTVSSPGSEGFGSGSESGYMSGSKDSSTFGSMDGSTYSQKTGLTYLPKNCSAYVPKDGSTYTPLENPPVTLNNGSTYVPNNNSYGSKDSVGYETEAMVVSRSEELTGNPSQEMVYVSSTTSGSVSVTATIIPEHSAEQSSDITTLSPVDITVKAETIKAEAVKPNIVKTETVKAECPISSSSKGSGSEGPEDGRKFTAHVLPPCRVCGAQATGFHYGVNTCEACKGFFHRSLTRHHTYVCLKNSKCEVKPGRRNSCSYCRYQRCLAVNMSKNSIKTGRYTYEKRTKDILELNKLKGKTRTKVDEAEVTKKNEEFIAEIMVNKDKLIEGMLKAAHRKYNPNFSEEDLEKGRIKLRCLAPQSPEEAGQNDELVKKWIDAVEHSGGLKHIIVFIKSTPGFKDVDMTDQIQIIKASFCELWIIGRHNAFNPAKHTFTSIHGIRFDLVQALGQEFADTIARVIRRLQKIKLNEEETFLLMLMAVFSADRAELTVPEPIDAIHGNIVQALLHIINKAHSSSIRFAQMCACLAELRTVSYLYHHLTKTLVSTSDQEIPPLFWELISLS